MIASKPHDFLTDQSAGNSNKRHAIEEAIRFLSKQDLLTCNEDQLALNVMQVAYIIDVHNSFTGDINVDPRKMAEFELFMSYMLDSDIACWCRKLFDSTFWHSSNRVIVNVIWNWMTDQLDEPEVFLRNGIL